ncbi:MAG TPA: hypothetical protein VG939_18375 [Caulobacteraceae bacterium]|nr:hypothetical protein [Caulobacteraceae bacterium]
MLFLLNDTVLELEAQAMTPPQVAATLSRMTLIDAITLAKEAFAVEPELHRRAPERAKKAALLILLKQPQINAAQFIVPARHCNAKDVQVRFAALGAEVMFDLKALQDRGKLTAAYVDVHVWSRAAAAA